MRTASTPLALRFWLACGLAACGLAACGPFVPDPTGPGGGPGPGPGAPTLAIPFKLGTTESVEGRGIVVAGDGVVLTGWFVGTVDFDPRGTQAGKTSFGAQDVVVARYAFDGALDWVVSFGGSGADLPTAIAATPDGGTVVVGYGSGGGLCGGTVATSHGGRDVLVMKLSATGDCLWAHLLGGPDDDEARAVAVSPDGAINVVGFFAGSADFDGPGSSLLQSFGQSDGFLLRLAADGSFLGAVRGGGTDADRYTAVAVAPNGEVSVGGEMAGTGSFGSALAPVVLQSAGGTDGVIARYTALLGLRWATRLGGPLEDKVATVTSDPSGDVLVAGTFEGTADLDPSGGTSLVVSQGAADIFLARYSGVTGQWGGLSRAIGGAGSEGVTRMVLHSSGRLLLTGFFQGAVDFDPSAAASVTVARGTGGAGDGFLLGLDQQGNYGWVVPIGGTVGGAQNLSIASDATVDPIGRVWTTGRFFGRADFDPSGGAAELVALSGSNIFVSRYFIDTGAIRTEPLP
ncbi:MAG TPA: hypothetical protein VFN22_01165 [Gemmatimonadales bacterium]|nr:hypothetical protein [Gemmatimonadales bacterium]